MSRASRQGVQGILDEASNQALDDEFGTHKEEEVVQAILEKGNAQETEVCFPFACRRIKHEIN